MFTTMLMAGLATAALHDGDGTRDDDVPAASFSKPVRFEAAGAPVRVEAPGYASPAFHDMNGDGRADLVVGQFAGGKMRVFHRQENGGFGEGEWLEAEGEVAQVPGVW